MYAWQIAQKEALTALKKQIGKGFTVTVDQLVTPPRPEFGDLSFPTFALAKGLRKNPNELAVELAAKIGPSTHIKSATAMGPYVNFVFEPVAFGDLVLADILKGKARYGKGKTGVGKRVLIEYANLNTHKEVHVGHLRNFSVGQSLVNLFRMNGFDVTPVSYINDLGNNVAKCLWGMVHLYPDFEPEAKDRLNFLGRVYSEATAIIANDDSARAEVSQIQRDLENMEGEMVALWKKTKQWSLEGLQKAFDEFGLELKKIYLEHELIDETHEIVKRLLTNGIAKVSEGAVIVDLTEQKLGVNLLRKTDGTLLYNAKDIALAYHKESDYSADRSLIVVDNRQTLAFQQLRATLRLMGFEREVIHVPYEFVTLPEGAMSSRKGNIVRWDDIFAAIKTACETQTAERHTDWSRRKVAKVAEALSIASIKFAMLKLDPDKVITFKLDEALSYSGPTAPYILYTIARARKVIGKTAAKPEINADKLSLPEERALFMLLAKFPQVLVDAQMNLKPSQISLYAYDLALAFSSYYESVRVLDDSDDARLRARLGLYFAAAQVLENALSILGIKALKEM